MENIRTYKDDTAQMLVNNNESSSLFQRVSCKDCVFKEKCEITRLHDNSMTLDDSCHIGLSNEQSRSTLFEIDKKNFEDINLRIKIKRMHIESLESYVKELKEENEQLESKITQKDDMIETLSSELDSKADECISCETDNKKLKSKIETLNNTFDKSKARLEYYRGLADGQERLINTLLKINSALTSKLLQ